MDKTAINRIALRRENRFRAPSPIERHIGLWVDRIGAAVDRRNGEAPHQPCQPDALRILGQYAAVYVKSGRGLFFSRKMGETPVAPGNVILLFPGEPATYYPLTVWKTLWVVWKGPEARRLEQAGFMDMTRPVLRDPHRAVARAHALLHRIHHHEGREAALLRRLAVEEMLLELFRAKSFVDGAADARAEEAVRYVVEHCQENLTPRMLAARVNLGMRQFRRIFEAHTGQSPGAFIAAQRIARAREFLADGLPIKVAAARTGFSDIFYFMRVFRRVTGFTAGGEAAKAVRRNFS